MSGINLRKRLCRQLCPHYKPSKTEELTCRGFLVVEGFIKAGKEIPFNISNRMLHVGTEKILRQHLCLSCSFYESNCDFAQHGEGAFPCGGFSLLGELLETRNLTIDNMKDIR